MKIAILGAKGFVGRNLAQHFKQHHTVLEITRDNLNLLDFYSVKNFLQLAELDCVICCAATMNNTLDDVANNFGIILNFYHNRHLFNKFINTASGAEFDRSRDIDLAMEHEIYNRFPIDSYGLGQNLRSRLADSTENFYNLRIFNCFGQGEISTRIFPKFLNTATDFRITDNRFFDYFSIHDLIQVVDYYLNETTPFYKDINCVYPNKYRINEVLEMFRDIHNIKTKIVIDTESKNNYTGDWKKLNNLPIKLTGLVRGLQDYK